jgi:hypothetical protein
MRNQNWIPKENRDPKRIVTPPPPPPPPLLPPLLSVAAIIVDVVDVDAAISSFKTFLCLLSHSSLCALLPPPRWRRTALKIPSMGMFCSAHEAQHLPALTHTPNPHSNPEIEKLNPNQN